MMNENNDDDEEIILDRRDLIPRANKPSSTSGSILLGLNQFNIGIYDDSNKISKEKSIILAATCISIGMFTGLLGPTFPFLAENMSKDSASIIWLITIKSIGFLIGICLSCYFYTWFNVCYLLGLACFSISFGVCSLPFIIDLITFYFISFILGIGLGLSYNGIDALYNHLWSRSTIRWLHLLIVLGAIISTLLLFPSTISNDNSILSTTNTTQSLKLRRAVLNDTANKLPLETERTTSKSIYINSYCCYHKNNRSNTFTCHEKNQSNDCRTILSSCQPSVSNICTINNTDIQCRIDRICVNETAIELINTTSFTTLSSISTSKTNAITHHSKPPMAISDNDDLSKNFFYKKLGLIFHSITYIHFLYLILALSFLILGIFYSILAICGEGINSSSIKNLNPLSLIFIKPYRIVNNSNPQILLLSDRSSLKVVFFIILFYFILSGIENSCNYLAYSFGMTLKLSKTKNLFLQFCYLFGRLIDILINYTLFLLNKQTDIISIKFLIIFRLMILFAICFLNLFENIFYFLFFSIGFFLTSLSSLILYWLERNFCLNEKFLRMILFTIIISESIFPVFLFYKIQYFIQYYLLIALCLLMILFLIILYLSKKWQENRYRLLSTAIEMESEDNSDHERLENSKFH